MGKLPLECSHLVKYYGSYKAVDDVSFEVQPGECLGIIGPNGAGKTSIIKMCLGTSQPHSGVISSFDQSMPEDRASIKQRLGVVNQFDTLDPDFTCYENLLVFGRYFGLKDAAIRDKIPSLLEFAALTHKTQAKPGALSGGMKRRLSLARALINDPSLLLLDEPTTGLDPQARHTIWSRLDALLLQNKSILLTTHFMDEAQRLCHRLLIMDQGKIIDQGTPSDLIQKLVDPHVFEIKFSATPIPQALIDQASRYELRGDSYLFYVQNPTHFQQELQHCTFLSVLHRPANLEDVFLKLTGRQMREGS
ncbi:MAG: ATP-binding cassette domain-containing protein [Gammaproteobacteria bacterium]|nr:ATP-binding cassette domain-containing protein [Gammaproteobacteria bacterium]